MSRTPVTFEHQGNGEILVLRTFENLLEFGLTEGQLSELAAITPRGVRDFGGLIVSEVELKALGRWAGEAQPIRRRRIRASG